MTTAPELQLTPALRAAQRAIAAWLDRSGTDARRAAFGARAALARLDRTDYGRLSRWLAWLCVASRPMDGTAPDLRIHRLDPQLGRRIAAEIERLPPLVSSARAGQLLRSA